jgi:hypothetical protein
MLVTIMESSKLGISTVQARPSCSKISDICALND